MQVSSIDRFFLQVWLALLVGLLLSNRENIHLVQSRSTTTDSNHIYWKCSSRSYSIRVVDTVWHIAFIVVYIYLPNQKFLRIFRVQPEHTMSHINAEVVQ